MTRDEIIKLAREAGFAINTRTGEINASHGSYNWIISRELERFASLVAAAEREACAKASEQQIERWVDDRARYAASECAAAIRARSQTSPARMCPSTYYECRRGCGNSGCKDFEDAHRRSHDA